MKAFTASIGGGGSILCSHRLNLAGNHQLTSLNQFPPLNLRRSYSYLTNQDHLLEKPKSYLRFKFVIARAADSSQASVPAAAAGGKSIVEDSEFSLAKVSFGVIGLGLGLSLLSYGFGAYFNILPGSEWSALMLTYGFPLSIIGMALKYAELKPVPCLTYSDAQILREKCATPILKQVRDDVIRYRYGDEQHLDEALKRIFQYGLGGGVARRNAPVLQKIREEVTEDGKYCLVLVFEAKALELADFEKRQEKFASFFGPGISAEVGKEEEENMYNVHLISNTTL
ncbi:hypothetical protein L1987_47076 [Smallanthus sonchifolius]|uniref:Uncharacterized protein n=1 Tax=Smallanthus sonchifolius TaxID=185202 RepID=A0ACB9G1J5_9ASTR|nr:hypothetical protein L1987_47076 [Smallanthus sonchifolius]